MRIRLFHILKVQTPAVRLSVLGKRFWFGAHNFLAIVDGNARTIQELHGIARGPAGRQLRFYGGLLPFRAEYIWGEAFRSRTGFYHPTFPQADLAIMDAAGLERMMAAAERVRDEVNCRTLRYPWPALFGANSNAYYATMIAALGLKDIRVPGQLWAPSAQRLLLPRDLIGEISSLARH